MYASRETAALRSTVDTLKRDINEILTSGKFYVTGEIAQDMESINNGLDHLKLDTKLTTTSKNWKTGFDPQQISAHAANATTVLDKAAAFLFDYKNKMGAHSIESSQENEIRELHHWAKHNLQQLQAEVEPYTAGAASRVHQFGDHIGVTDRYTGYRNNLTRGSREPFKLEAKWMDKNFRQGYWSGIQRSQKNFPRYERENATLSAPVSASASNVRFGSYAPPRREVKGYQTVDSLFPRSTTMYVDNPAAQSQKLHELKTANALNAMSRDDSHVDQTSRTSGPRALSVQEQAGINTTFPGNTEYMTRYAWPKSDMKASRFTINPTPDFTLHGRPLGLTSYEPSFTEYQSRFEWPDGNRIVKLPWLRK